MVETRREVAAFLHERGPIWGDAAALAMGLTEDQWWAAVNGCPWFSIESAGWTLTDRGRNEALAPACE